MIRNMRLPYRSIIIAWILLLWLFPARIIWADDIAMFEIGNNLLRQHEYTEALSAYETFAKENPKHRLTPAAKWTMANIYMVINNDYESAIELFQSIISENVDTEWEFSSYDRLGSCFEAQQKWEDAAAVYQPAIQKLSISSEDAVTQARVRGYRIRLLSCYRNMNDHESVISIYQKTLAEDPAALSAAEDQFNLSQAYMDVQNMKEAAKNYVLVVERYPASNYAQRVQSEQTDLLTSQLDYDWTPFSTFLSAQTLSRTGQYEEALTQFDEIIETKRNAGMAYAARFQKELIEFRKNGDAAAFMEKIDSSRNEYPYGFGGVRVDQLNYYLGGIVEAQGNLETNPEDIGAYMQMGQCYYVTQAYNFGIETFKKAITIAPNTLNLYNMLSYCYLGVLKYDEAISTFQKLIDNAPNDPNSYDSMAEGYYYKGDTTMAIQFYQKSLGVDSSFTNPYYMLGRIYQEQGQNEKAVEHLEKYLELDPGGYQSQNVQNLLNQLNPPSNSNE